MAIECYKGECPFHEKTEPFCNETDCVEYQKEFFVKYPIFEQALRMGAACGLTMVFEAVSHLHLHACSIYSFDSLEEQFTLLFEAEREWEKKMAHPREIPRWIVDEENKKIDEYFESQKDKEVTIPTELLEVQ